MDYNSNYLQTLIEQGNDAQTNMYLAEINFDKIDKPTSYSVRCKGFNPPRIEQQAYSARFLNIHIDRPRAKINVDKFFDLTFRVDVNYTIYDKLRELAATMIDGNKNKNVSNIEIASIKKKNFTVIIKALEGDSNDTIDLYKYKDCWIESITPIAYKQGTSDPAEVTVRVNYLTFEDLQNDAANDFIKGNL